MLKVTVAGGAQKGPGGPRGGAVVITAEEWGWDRGATGSRQWLDVYN